MIESTHALDMETPSESSTLLPRNIVPPSTSRSLLRAFLPTVLLVSAISAVGGWISRGLLAPQTLKEVDDKALGILVSNEYGQFKDHTRDAYGFFDFILEPERKTTFSVRNGREGALRFWEIGKYDQNTKASETLLMNYSGSEMIFKPGPGTNIWYRVSLTEKKSGFQDRTFTSDRVFFFFLPLLF